MFCSIILYFNEKCSHCCLQWTFNLLLKLMAIDAVGVENSDDKVSVNVDIEVNINDTTIDATLVYIVHS